MHLSGSMGSGTAPPIWAPTAESDNLGTPGSGPGVENYHHQGGRAKVRQGQKSGDRLSIEAMAKGDGDKPSSPSSTVRASEEENSKCTEKMSLTAHSNKTAAICYFQLQGGYVPN